MMTTGKVLQWSRRELTNLQLQLQQGRRVLRPRDGMRRFSQLLNNTPNYTALNSAERARQVERHVAEALLDAFRAGAVRR